MAMVKVEFQRVEIELPDSIARWTKKRSAMTGAMMYRCPDCTAWDLMQVAAERDQPSSGQRERAEVAAAWRAVEPDDGPFSCSWCAQEERMFGDHMPNAHVELRGSDVLKDPEA